MTAWTGPRTWTATTVAVADLNTDIRDNMLNVDERLTISGITSPSALNKVKSARCGVRCTNVADITATTGTDKTLLWDTEGYDTDAFHSVATNTHRITIPAGLDGDYLFSVTVQWEANSTGERVVWFEDSAGNDLGRMSGRAATTPTRTTVTLTKPLTGLVAAGWVSVHCQQDSGSTLTIYHTVPGMNLTALRLFAA